MSINIKNERVSQLAVRLAEKTGESITDAVGHAIEEKLAELEKLERMQRRKGLADKLRALAEDFRRDASAEWLAKTQKEMDDEMYDEMGLPR